MTKLRTHWGYTASPAPGETLEACMTRQAATLGKPHVLRVYDNTQGIAAAWRTAQTAGAPDVPVVLSWKRPPAQVIDKSGDADAAAVFEALGEHDFWVYGHEADAHSLGRHEYTAAEFIAAWQHNYTLAASVGCKAKACLILTGWDYANRLPMFYPGRSYVDALAVDPYAQPGQTAEQIMTPLFDQAALYGLPLGIAETGMDNRAGSEAVTAYVESLRWLKHRALFVTYFNYDENPGVPYRIDQMPAAAVAWQSLRK